MSNLLFVSKYVSVIAGLPALYSRKPTPLTENQSSRYQLMVLRCVRGVRGAQQRQKRACLQKADRPFSNVTSDLTDLTNELLMFGLTDFHETRF